MYVWVRGYCICVNVRTHTTIWEGESLTEVLEYICLYIVKFPVFLFPAVPLFLYHFPRRVIVRLFTGDFCGTRRTKGDNKITWRNNNRRQSICFVDATCFISASCIIFLLACCCYACRYVTRLNSLAAKFFLYLRHDIYFILTLMERA